MKEYKYRGYEYPIIVDDNGNTTYRGYEVEKYFHSYNPVGVGSGFSIKTLAKQHYVSEMDRIDKEILFEEKREEFEKLHSANEDLEFFFSILEE